MALDGPRRGGAPADRHNLPLRLSSIVGRAHDLGRLAKLVGRHRLVTLSGAPGCGKTRLAEELGRRLVDRFADGVWVVDIAAISKDCDIEEHLLGILAIPNESTTATRILVRDYLRDRQSLLILDNCEYRASCAVAFASDLLLHCPRLSMIATSREPLRVDGEVVWSVLPLQVPPPSSKPQDVFRYDSAALWLDRVRQLRPDFSASVATRAAVSELCRRLDGIPLGLELAAAWSIVFSPQEVLQRLETRAPLTDRARPEDDRHSSLHSAISWSCSQLSDASRETFRALGLFQGECHLDAIARVCGLPDADVTPIVAELVEKSLVTVGASSDDGSTYGMLTTIREFAMRELQSSGEYPATRDRYIEHYLALAEKTATVVGFVDGMAQVRRLETEYANVDRALALASWSQRDRAARLTAALCPYWEYRGRPDPAIRWLTEVLSHRHCDSATWCRCTTWLAVMTMWKRPEGIQTALDLNGQGLNLARRLGDQSLIVTIQQHRALILNAAGQLEEARQVAEDGAAVAAGLRHRQLLALCVFRLGAIALTGGDPEGALDGLTRSLAMARELGWIELRALALVGLTQANVLLERYDGAGASIEECLHCYEALTPRRFTILSEAMATVEKSRQQGDRAAVMLDIARKLRSDYSLRLSESWRPRQEDANPRRTRRLSRAALVPGGPLYKERLAAALLQLRSAPPAAGHHTTPPRSGSLTRREREVVDLIGMGLTNRQIAERLSIAERTAEGHVERLRKKLRVHSRSAIAARMELLDAGAAEEAVDAGAQRRPSRVV